MLPLFDKKSNLVPDSSLFIYFDARHVISQPRPFIYKWFSSLYNLIRIELNTLYCGPYIFSISTLWLLWVWCLTWSIADALMLLCCYLVVVYCESPFLSSSLHVFSPWLYIVMISLYTLILQMWRHMRSQLCCYSWSLCGTSYLSESRYH